MYSEPTDPKQLASRVCMSDLAQALLHRIDNAGYEPHPFLKLMLDSIADGATSSIYLVSKDR